MSVCRECRDGKHVNCTGEALNAEDEFVDCECPCRVPDGWFPFGTHADKPGPLEFSEATGEDGLPLWERPL